MNPTGKNGSSTRHKWNGVSLRGGKSITCNECGCKQTKRRTPGSRKFETFFQMPGGPEVTERPPCPAKKP